MAAPAYNQYKKTSTKTALRSELSNGVKAYNAYNAVNASYCANFEKIGFNPDDTAALYKKKAWLGFNDVEAATCDVTHNANSTIYIKTQDAGSCADSTHTTRATCEQAAEIWTSEQANDGPLVSDCILKEGDFIIGAVTGVSALDTFFTMDEDGRTDERTITSYVGGSPQACATM